MNADKVSLTDLGWDDFFEAHRATCEQDALVPARVSQEHRNRYHVLCEPGELTAEVSGRMRHEARSRAEYPSVGDWVLVSVRRGEGQATIHAVLPRKSVFSRKMVSANDVTEEQILAANVDTVFLVSGLDGDFNLRRIERLIPIAWDSGATPVVVLNKADLCPEVDARMSEVEAVAVGAEILAVSAASGEGLERVRQYLAPGRTVAFLGSSGVGKSTIINRLLGQDRQKTHEVREHDSRGRHTTTYRELILVPGGGIVVDTPGLRTIQMWDATEGFEKGFADIESLASQCRFSDCHHESEPGCAIQAALADGTLDGKRYDNYLKQQKELDHLRRRIDLKARRQAERAFDKRVQQYHRTMKELRKKGLA